MQRPSSAVVVASIVALLSAVVFSPSAQAHGTDNASSVGTPGDAKNATRTITVTMRDSMRFEPPKIIVRKSETIRFVVTNAGKVRHEMTLGSKQELKEHAGMMREMPDMTHQDANSVTVGPGQTGDLVWRFTRTGTFEFACLEPGHPEAGMKGTITVK
ncbi:cupredoxin family protein [Paraburkholderia sp. MPAMCS5]|uniref:cupredoxin domain-containing protein n=1 Tax=Paraburkholderia sp. MPAMCS5 TaxID=3112563 RepID=UPI002E190DB2|nr:cupredoxin family protein [Paraburkholderia sp. MPAMCS5]